MGVKCDNIFTGKKKRKTNFELKCWMKKVRNSVCIVSHKKRNTHISSDYFKQINIDKMKAFDKMTLR